MGILKEIVEKKKIRLDHDMAVTPMEELRSRIGASPPPRPFGDAVKRDQGGPVKVIAEIKKASPSKGMIREDFDPETIARIYEGEGAAAISVLTEEDFFMGCIDYIKRVKDVTSVPVLRKDFIIDEYQIYEARARGADAVLLIASILDSAQAEEYLHMASELALSVLFEVHDAKELDLALRSGAGIVGINNRNLDTLKIDLDTTIRMLDDIPEDRIIVTESGISTRDDVVHFEKSGIDAILIGTALMKERDISAKYKELFI